MLSFNRKYIFAATILFFLEVGIAVFVRDAIIRPYGGDFLVVLFLYCLLRGVVDITTGKATLIVVFFAYLVEIMQYLDLIGFLGLQENTIAKILIGTNFEWIDMLVYTLGALFIYLIEQISDSRRKKKK